VVFSAISQVSSFEADSDTDNLVGPGWEKKKKKRLYWVRKNPDCKLGCAIDTVRSRIKVEWEKLYSKADLSKQKWNCLVSWSQHSWLWDLSIRGGGGGWWQWKFWHLTDSFACWSTLRVILFRPSFHLILDQGYRVFPASHAKHSVSAGTWYQHFLFIYSTRGTFMGENWQMLV